MHSISAGLVTLLVLSEYVHSTAGVWVFKPLSSLAFLLHAFNAPEYSTPFGQAIFYSLLLAFLGDILLIPKNETCFTAGLVSFLLGHLGYIYAFSFTTLDTASFSKWLLLLSLTGLAVWKLYLSPSVPRDMKIPVQIYILVITIMLATAVGTSATARHPNQQILGAALFYVSDLCVAREQFVSKTWWNQAVGLPLYYAAQMVMAGLLY